MLTAAISPRSGTSSSVIFLFSRGLETIVRDQFANFKCSANDAVEFKLVRKAEDVDDPSTTFKADMTHQIYGENESIFGYKDLRIQLYYSAACLNTYLNVKYSDKIDPAKCDGVTADDVLRPLMPEIPPNPERNLDEFIRRLPADAKFKPFGEMVHQYTLEKNGVPRTFQIHRCKIDEPGFSAFHERLQTFLLFFVDAASYIDADDDRWTFYLIFEKYQENANPMFAVCGYMTVYSYYAYPEKLRPRISQVLILPPFQRQGHCAKLIETFYAQCQNDDTVRDITVEDPNEGFQRVRDYVDVKNCSKLDSYQPAKLKQGFCTQMWAEAQDCFKLNKKQARRVYEILRLACTNLHDETEYRAYRLDVKRRINQPFQKSGREMNKLSQLLQPDEVQMAETASNEQRLAYLQKTYDDTVEQYRKTLDRVELS